MHANIPSLGFDESVDASFRGSCQSQLACSRKFRPSVEEQNPTKWRSFVNSSPSSSIRVPTRNLEKAFQKSREKEKDCFDSADGDFIKKMNQTSVNLLDSCMHSSSHPVVYPILLAGPVARPRSSFPRYSSLSASIRAPLVSMLCSESSSQLWSL